MIAMDITDMIMVMESQKKSLTMIMATVMIIRKRKRTTTPMIMGMDTITKVARMRKCRRGRSEHSKVEPRIQWQRRLEEVGIQRLL